MFTCISMSVGKALDALDGMPAGAVEPHASPDGSGAAVPYPSAFQ